MKPGWVDNMPTGQWFRISGDRPDLGLQPTMPGTRYLVDNDPAKDLALNPAQSKKEKLRRWLGKSPDSPWRGRCGFSSITEAWNGAVLASRFGESGSMVIFGGGHDDYFGSDIHAFDLHAREWSRIADGFISPNFTDYGAGAIYPNAEYPDGSPLPPHTYDYVQYDPVRNDYILFKGQLELGPDVKAVSVPHMFNFDTLSWRRGPQHPTAILNAGGWTTWDESRRILWGHSGDAGGGNAFLSFDPAGKNPDGTFGAWGEIFPNKLVGEADHNTMAIDSAGNIIVVLVHSRNQLCAIDPARPKVPMLPLHTSPGETNIHEYAALEYAPNLQAFICYSAADGATLYKLTPPRGKSWIELTNGIWTWESVLHRRNSLNPVADASRVAEHDINTSHTFGRFRLATYGDVDLAILVRHVDSPVYAMRLN